MEETTNQLNTNNIGRKMNWNNFVPTREIREYDMRLRESVRQREQMKAELAELEKHSKDIFWNVEYAMLSTGIKYFNTCSEYWLYKLENEYITAENEYLAKQTDFYMQYPLNIECCLKKISYICAVFRVHLGDNTYLKVFSHCPNLKMWQFSTNQGQRIALILV